MSEAEDRREGAREKGFEEQAEGAWKQFTGRLQEAWGALTDDDLDRFRGQRRQLIGRIQEKTGEAREAVARKVDEIAEKLDYRFGDRGRKGR